MCGRVGSLKSSVMRIICDDLGITPTFNLTTANILGSVDKTTGMPILPTVWDCRGNIMPIDEFYIDSSNNYSMGALRTLLSVLEFPKYEKRVSYRINNFEKKDKNGMYCIMRDGIIKVNTKFVFMANTMMELFRHSKCVEIEALKTRCLILPYYPSLIDIRNMISGMDIYKRKLFNYEKKCVMSYDNYTKIMDLVQDSRIKEEYFARTVGDLCRIFAITGFKVKYMELIINLRNYTHYD